jgi:nitrogen regulatory protein PII
MFLLEEHLVKPILEAIKTAGEFHKPGTGIAFVLPVEHVIGLESQMEKFKEEVRNKYL